MSFGFGGRRLSGVDLLGLGDLKVTAIDERHDGVTVDAEAIELDGVPVCECGGSVYKHGMRTISVRDSTIRRLPTVLRIKRRRYRCQACGSILMNRLAGLRDDRDMTERLRKQIAEDAIDRTFTDAATLNGVNDKTVKRIFDEIANERLNGYSFTLPTVLGMDEKVISGIPRFVLGDMNRRTLLDMLPDRKATNLAKYFNNFGHYERQNVRVITQDMYWPYKDLNERFFKSATVVIDKFHVLRYANDAVDRVRIAIQRDLDDEGRIAMKRSNKLLKMRAGRLNDERKQRLEGILRLHPMLSAAVHMKEAFYDLYECQTVAEAGAHYDAWEELLPHELRKPFKQVISYMRHTRWRRLILNYFDHRYTNAYAESLNGLIDAVQRAGRGYDFETLRAKALLRYGPFRYEAANKMNFLTFLRYHGVDLSTFEDDLRAGRF